MLLEGRLANGAAASEPEERQPLLPDIAKIVANGGQSPPESGKPDTPSLRIILPALMVCAFLAAFDVTVVAAIYPIMFGPC
jgi:hypothetical protein